MIYVRDVHSGKELARWQGHEAPISVLTFSPDRKFLVSGARDGTIKLWDLAFLRKELAVVCFPFFGPPEMGVPRFTDPK